MTFLDPPLTPSDAELAAWSFHPDQDRWERWGPVNGWWFNRCGSRPKTVAFRDAAVTGNTVSDGHPQAWADRLIPSSKPWAAVGVHNPQAAADWINVGMTPVVHQHYWDDDNSLVVDAMNAWNVCDVPRPARLPWFHVGFTPGDASAWWSAGFSYPITTPLDRQGHGAARKATPRGLSAAAAADWRDAGFGPLEAGRFHRAGFHPGVTDTYRHVSEAAAHAWVEGLDVPGDVRDLAGLPEALRRYFDSVPMRTAHNGYVAPFQRHLARFGVALWEAGHRYASITARDFIPGVASLPNEDNPQRILDMPTPDPCPIVPPP